MKIPFIFHVTETRHFELEIYASSEEAAIADGAAVWSKSPAADRWRSVNLRAETKFTVSSSTQKRQS